MQNNRRFGMVIVLLSIAVLCSIHILRNLSELSAESYINSKHSSNKYIDLIPFDKHNFTLLVPSNISIHDKFPNSSIIDSTWMQGAVGSGEPVASLNIFHFKIAKAYPSEWRVELRISVTTDPIAMESIEKKSIYTNQLPDIKLIRDVPFRVFPIEDAGMMKAVSGYSYRTIHEGKGYVFEVISYGNTYRDVNFVDQLNDGEIDRHTKRALEIIESLTFINPKNTE